MDNNILNLTAKPATQMQSMLGVKDTVYLEWVQRQLDIRTLYQVQTEIGIRAEALADLAEESGFRTALVDGSRFFMPTLVEALKNRGITPLFFVSEAEDLPSAEPEEPLEIDGERLYTCGFVDA